MITQEVIQQLLRSFKELQKENKILKERITILEEKLSKYENPKDSNNSSIPPSHNETKIPHERSESENLLTSNF